MPAGGNNLMDIVFVLQIGYRSVELPVHHQRPFERLAGTLDGNETFVELCGIRYAVEPLVRCVAYGVQAQVASIRGQHHAHLVVGIFQFLTLFDNQITRPRFEGIDDHLFDSSVGRSHVRRCRAGFDFSSLLRHKTQYDSLSFRHAADGLLFRAGDRQQGQQTYYREFFIILYLKARA